MSKAQKKDADGLTVADRRFADEYLVDLNITRAAQTALRLEGKAASQTGWRLLQKKVVQAYVQRRIAERAERVQLSQDDVIQELRRIAYDPSNSESARVRALEVIGKHMGMFAPQPPPPPQVPTEPRDKDLAEMTDEQIDAELDRLLGEVGTRAASDEAAPGEKGKGPKAGGRPVRNVRPN